MKKILFIFCILASFLQAQTPNGTRKVWADTLKVSRGNQFVDILSIISDSTRNADGVTIVNSGGTFQQKVFANVAALEAATGSDGQIASIDNKFLYVQMDSADVVARMGSATDNDVTVLSNAGANKRWVSLDYLLTGKVSIDMAGAVGDGATDDSDAFDAAYAAANGKILYMPRSYYLPDPIYIRQSITIEGKSKEESTIRGNVGGSYGGGTLKAIWIRASNVSIRNVTLDTMVICLDSTISNITIENVHVKNYSVVGSERGAIFTDDDAPNTTVLKNVTINNCIVSDFENNGAITFIADSLKNLRLTNNIVRDGKSTTTNQLLGTIGNIFDSLIVITGNQIYNINYDNSRLWPIIATGTPLVVANNQISNITGNPDLAGNAGLECIRGASYNYIISGNTVTNCDSVGNIVSMKGDGTTDGRSVGIIANNSASNCRYIAEGFIAPGKVSIVGNQLSGNIGIFLQLASANFYEDTIHVANNTFSDVSSLTRTARYYVGASQGIFTFTNNVWTTRSVSTSGSFFYQPTSLLDSTVTIIANGEVYNFSDTELMGPTNGFNAPGYYRFSNCDFNIRDFNQTLNYFISVTTSGYEVKELIFSNCNFFVDSTNTMYAVAQTYDNMKFVDSNFYIDGTLNSVFTMLGGRVDITKCLFDLKKAQGSTINVFRDLGSNTDSLIVSSSVFRPASRILIFYNMLSGATADTVNYLSFRNNDISATRMFSPGDADDNIRTVELYNNALKYTYWNLASGSITTVNHAGNAQVGTPATTHRIVNSGTASITSGNTSTDVSHYLFYTPPAHKIKIVPTSSMGSASYFYIDNIGSSTFRINTNADPAATASFAWEITE